MIMNLKKWDASVLTQISHYNHNTGSSKRPESFGNCVLRFKIFVLTSKACFSEPNSSKDVRVKSFLFLNSTLISKTLLSKFDRTRANILATQEIMIYCFNASTTRTHRLTVSLNLCLHLYSVRWLKFNQRRVSNFKQIWSDTQNVEFSLTFINLVKKILNSSIEWVYLKLAFNFFHSLMQ